MYNNNDNQRPRVREQPPFGPNPRPGGRIYFRNRIRPDEEEEKEDEVTYRTLNVFDVRETDAAYGR